MKTRGSAVAGLLQNFDIARDTLKTAMEESEGSAERELENVQKGIQYSLDKFHATVQELATDTISSDLIKSIVDFGTAAVSAIDKVVTSVDSLGKALASVGGIWGASTLFKFFTKGTFKTDGLLTKLPVIGKAISGWGKAGNAGIKGLEKFKSYFDIAGVSGGLLSNVDALKASLSSLLFNPFTKIIGGATIAVGAIIAVKKAIDETNGTASAKRAEKAWGDYTKTSTELEEVQTKIKETGNRIDELNAKGGLTLVEQDELNKLKESYDLLLLEEKQLKDRKKQAAEEYVTNAERSFRQRSARNIETQYDANNSPVYVNSHSDYEKDIHDYLNKQLIVDNYKKNNASKLSTNSYKSNVNRLQKEANSAKDTLLDTRDELQTMYTNLRTLQNEGSSLFDKDLFKSVGEQLKDVMDAVDPGSWQKIQEETINNTKAYKDQRDTLVSLAKEREHLTRDDVIVNAKSYYDAYKEAGLSMTDLINSILSEAGVIDIDKALQSSLKKIDDKNIRRKISSYLNSLSEDDLKLVLTADIDWNNIKSGNDLKQWLEDNAKSQVESALDGLKTEVSSVIEQQQNATEALGNVGQGTGLTTEQIEKLTNAYKGLDSFDAQKLFENAARGVQVNREELERLQSEVNKNTERDLMDQLIQKQLELDQAKASGNQTAITDIQNEILSLSQLMSQLDASTDAYQRFVNSQSAGKESDGMENVGKSYESMKKLLDDEWYNDPALNSYVDLLIGDKDGTITERFNKISETIEGTSHSLKDYFTFNKDGSLDTKGVEKFADDLQLLLGDELTDENGMFDATDENLQKVADRFGTTTDMVELFFEAMDRAGYDVEWANPLEHWDEGELSETVGLIQEAQKSIEEIGKENVHAEIGVEGESEAEQKVDRIAAKLSELPQEKLVEIGFKDTDNDGTISDEEIKVQLPDINFDKIPQSILDGATDAADKLTDSGKTVEEYITSGAKKILEYAEQGAEALSAAMQGKYEEYQKEKLQKLNEETNGNVDFTNRPIVSGDKMREKYPNYEGTYSTTFTGNDTLWIGDEEHGHYESILFTPILPNGDVLDREGMDDYLRKICETGDILSADKPENGGKGLIINATPVVDSETNQDFDKYHQTGEKSEKVTKLFEEQVEFAEHLHNEQAPYYDRIAESAENASEKVDDLTQSQKNQKDNENSPYNKPNVINTNQQNTIGEAHLNPPMENPTITPHLTEADNTAEVKKQMEDEMQPEVEPSIEYDSAQASQAGQDISNDIQNGMTTITPVMGKSETDPNVSQDTDGGNVIVNADMNDDQFQAGKAEVESGVDELNNKQANPIVGIIDHATSVIKDGIRLLDSFDGRNANSTITTTHVEKTVKESAGKATGTATFASGTASDMWVDYRHSIGAFADGTTRDWALPNDQVALVNEQGNESIVRNGRWSLLKGGAHLESLKRGDIVFSKSQTEQLIKYGKIAGHGRTIGGQAFAEGTVKAHVNGTAYNMLNLTNAYGGSSGAKSNLTNNTRTQNQKSKSNDNTSNALQSAAKKVGKNSDKTKKNSDKVAKDSASILEKVQNVIDWIEIRLSKDQYKIDVDNAQAKNAVTYQIKNEYVDKATQDTQTLIADNEAASKKYQDHANDVAKKLGLKPKKKLKKGKKGKKQAKKYAKYDKYLTKIEDGSMSIEQLANDLTKKSKGKKGKTKTTKNKDTLKAKLEEYKKWYDLSQEASKSAIELRQNLVELANTRFDNVTDSFEALSHQFEHANNIIDSLISSSESKGRITNERYYQEQIKNSQGNIGILEQQRAEQIASLNESVRNGSIQYDSLDWKNLKAKIDETTESIYKEKATIDQLNKTILEGKWDVFNTMQEDIQSLADESDFLVELMGYSDLFDKDTGKMTNTGLSTQALYTENIDIYTAKVKNYNDEIERTKQLIKEQPDNMDLKKHLDEVTKSRNDASLAIKKQEKSIQDLIKNGIQKEIEALNKLIKNYKDSLSSQKDLNDYSSSVQDKQKEISRLEKRIAIREADTSQEGQAELQRLRDELTDKKKDLDSTQMDHFFSDQNDTLDKLAEDYEKALNDRADDIEAVIKDSKESANANSKLIKETIEGQASDVGANISDNMKNIWGGDGQSVSTYLNGVFGTGDGNVFTAIKGVMDNILTAVQNANGDAQSNLNKGDGVGDPYEKGQTGTGAGTGGGTGGSGESNTSLRKGDGSQKDEEILQLLNMGKSHKKPLSKKEKKEHKPIWKYIVEKYGHQPTNEIYKELQIRLGLTASSKKTLTDKEKKTLLDKLKAHGYATGARKINEDENAWVGENNHEYIVRKSDGAILQKLNRGDSVLNAAQVDNIWSMSKNPEAFVKSAISGITIPNVNSGGNNVNMTVNNTFDLKNVTNPQEFMNYMKNNKTFENMIQDMTIGKLNGNSNRLTKYRNKF